MNPRSVSTIAVRLLGLVAVGVSLPTVGWFVHELLQAFCMGEGLARLSLFIYFDSDQELLNRAGWLVLFVLGLYLLLDGRWVIARVLRGLDGTCPNCGYDLKGVAGGVCPECGGKK